MIGIAYSIALLATALFAILRGGREGRMIVMIIASLFAVSAFLKDVSHEPLYAMVASLAVDCTSLSLKGWLALSSRRRWPIIVAGLQVVSVGMQLAICASPNFKLPFHDTISTVWAIPTLLVIALGIYLDRRHDLRVER